MGSGAVRARPGRVADLRRLFWYGAGVILSVAALVAIAAVLKGDFSETDGKILGTLGALFLAGSTTLAALALIERAFLVALGWGIAASTPVWFGIVAAGIWIEPGDDALSRWMGTAVILLLAELIVATNRLLVRSDRLLPVFAFTSIVLAVAVAITVGAIWGDGASEAAGKAAATFWILTALGYFLTPVVQRFARPATERPAQTLAALDGVELVATRTPEKDDVVVSAPRGRLLLTTPDGEVELGEGESLAVRAIRTDEQKPR